MSSKFFEVTGQPDTSGIITFSTLINPNPTDLAAAKVDVLVKTIPYSLNLLG